MKLRDVIAGLDKPVTSGSLDTEITGIAYDSRKAAPGIAFVAMRGTANDGHQFIPSAIASGAAAIIAETAPPDGSTVPWVAAGNPHGWEVAVEWMESGKELVAAAGWATLSSLASVKDDAKNARRAQSGQGHPVPEPAALNSSNARCVKSARKSFPYFADYEISRKHMEEPHIEQATLEDLPQLTDLLFELFTMEGDFKPDRARQMRGLRLILEQPSRGRIFVLRHNGTIFGMINLLFTISTAEGGFVILLEDVIMHRDFRGKGYGTKLLQHVIDYAKKKDFLRITLLTDRMDERSQRFFASYGFVPSKMIPMRLILDTPPAN